jgi:hypothetical protein
MKTEAKSFVVAGGAAYLASRYVFDATNRKAILYGIAGGLLVVAMLRLKLDVPGLPQQNVIPHDKAITPENLVPLNFKTGQPLVNNVQSQLTDSAVNDLDIAWGDNPYKNQVPTILGV